MPTMKHRQASPEDYRPANGRRRHADKRAIEAEKAHAIRRTCKAVVRSVKLRGDAPRGIDHLGAHYCAAYFGRIVSDAELQSMLNKSTSNVNLIDEAPKEERRKKPRDERAKTLVQVDVVELAASEFDALAASAKDSKGQTVIINNPKPAPQRVRKAAAA